jgi:HD-GYP domain-containing protein (c-di-GMP phosphodiesterase class II)
LVELLAALSLAADLGLGQAMEHGLRGCLIGARLAACLDVDQGMQDDLYWVSLLAMAGCTADSFEVRQMWGDDIALRAGMFDAGPSQFGMARYFLSRAGSDGGPGRRAQNRARLLANGMGAVIESITAHCLITGRLADGLDLGTGVVEPLQHVFARWDGKGAPKGLAGGDISLVARLFVVANYTEVAHRLRGVDASVEFARRFSGSVMDPAIVDALAADAEEIFAGIGDAPWDAVLASEPGNRPRLTAERLDAALMALSDFADLKTPWFAGHSRRVAELAASAANAFGLGDQEATEWRHAALVHSLGIAGVPNTIWDKEGPLTVAERERVQLYPYYTDRVMRHGSLAPLADLASAIQERCDGSGYPRGLSGAALPVAAKVLAAADVYDALTSRRPHRDPFNPTAAAAELRSEARSGRLDADAVEGVLEAAGHRTVKRSGAPADLTPREIEVLRLIAVGHTTAQVAKALTISVKTADHHIQHVYGKIGASNRPVAALFAMRNGLI